MVLEQMGSHMGKLKKKKKKKLDLASHHTQTSTQVGSETEM